MRQTVRFTAKSYVLAAFLLAVTGYRVEAIGTLDSSDIIFHFHGIDTNSHVGGRLAYLGDVNSDGYGDIAVSNDSPDGVYVFFGGYPVDENPDMLLRGSVGPNQPIDLDGDGIDDVIISHAYKASGNSHGMLYFYKGYGDSLGSVAYDSLLPDSLNYGFGETVSTGYVDGDSLGDILVKRWAPASSELLVFYSGCPALDTIPDWIYSEDGYAHKIGAREFIDYNGDGNLDIAVVLKAGQDTLSFVYIFFGPDFADSPDLILGYPVEIAQQVPDRPLEYYGMRGLYVIGDVDGDGWSDLCVPFDADALIYKCGPGADTVYDYLMEYPAGSLAPAGDVNGDGFSDLITYSYRYMPYHNVDVYLCGDVFDTRVDDEIKRSDLPPIFLDYIGWQLSTAGDFNGDGYDDFMFSCQNFAHGEPNDVFMIGGGLDIVTDVDEEKPQTLPGTLTLQQNYPNPFNSSTTIEFTLPRKDVVTLTVYNILGQRVANHVNNKSYSAGMHSVSWDGRMADGRVAPSGVYLYRLKGSQVSQVCKMVLMK